MTREDRRERDTTTEPAVPGPRQPQPQLNEGPPTPTPTPTAAVADDAGRGDTAPETPPAAPARGPGSSGHALERTRLGGTWVAIGCFAVVLLLLLVFILENSHGVSVSFFGTHSSLPLGVSLVLAAVCGALLVIFAGMARIMQMRARVRKHRRAQRKAAKS